MMHLISKVVFTIVFTSIASLTLLSQDCSIFPLPIHPVACEGDSVMTVFVHFEHEETSDSFDVESNHFELGRFAYDDLPVMVDIPLSGDTYENLHYYDSQDTTCHAVIEIMPTCDGEPCGLTPIETSGIHCLSDSTYEVTIDFDYHPDQDSFALSTPFENYGIYEYTELPITVEIDLSGNEMEYLTVVDFDDSYNCVRATEFEVDCGGTECELGHMTVSNIECPTDSTYLVTVDFDHAHTSDSFELSTRSWVVGTYAYSDLPIRIEVGLSGHSDELLRATDIEDGSCETATEFEVGCGGTECELGHMTVSNIECPTDSTYLVTVDFDHAHTSDSFELSTRSWEVGTFAYSDLPIRIEVGLSGHSDELLRATDIEGGSCETATEFEVGCGGTECELGHMTVSNIECPTDSTYLVTVDFDHAHTSDSFELSTRSWVVGTYAYSDLPIRVEVGLSGHSDELLRATDIEDGACETVTEFEVGCGGTECELGHMTVSNIECPTDSTYLVTVDFDHAHTSDSFELSTRSWVVGTYTYSDLPIRIEVGLSGHSDELLRATDIEDGSCETATEFEVNCGGEECEIEELVVSNIECIDETSYWVTLDFNYSGVQHTHFDVHTRDSLVGYFAYEDLPVRLQVPISGHDYELLRVNDNDHPECDAAVEFMVDCETSAVTAPSKSGVKLFPNPASRELQVRSDANWSGTFILQDLSGAIVMEGRKRSGSGIDVSALTPGLYILKLEFGEGTWIAKKVIIQSH